ncbi:hypothetical protein [Thiocystis violascens]|uniref:Uncharacterized protein n=1 Tax=Thiocystis violascens (strain ATCC 17096 / DSM 198 / 6111) TaxID=765911 RepID=I3YD98_THIV6|nr:hypothetical protein [Thiocystis violascens]AFL74966.1 hypothetical protein Thivi_3086 [Thiocystis violascens DSM 198]
MELPFTHKPGRRERHLRRRHENPLFAWPAPEVSPEALLAAQKADHEEMEAFRESFRALVRRAVELPPDAGSEIVLELKESLERQYEQSFGLPEDHAREREALRKLIDLIMRAIRKAAGADPLARQELADEEAARQIHFRLLEHPLIADLLHPQSPIAPDELAPTLLDAPLDEVAAALDLFDPEQIAQLADRSARLLENLAASGLDVAQPGQRIALFLARLDPEMTRRH